MGGLVGREEEDPRGVDRLAVNRMEEDRPEVDHRAEVAWDLREIQIPLRTRARITWSIFLFGASGFTDQQMSICNLNSCESTRFDPRSRKRPEV